MRGTKEAAVKTFATVAITIALLVAIFAIDSSWHSARAQGYVTNSGPVTATGGATVTVATARVLMASLGGTSPAAPSTVLGPTVTGIDAYIACTVLARLRGATGGPLDVFLQSSTDAGASWFDVAHYTQLAAGAALVAAVGTFAKGFAQSPAAVNTVDATPSIAAGTFQTNALGSSLRVVYVAGALTTAGAAQTLSLYCYNPAY